MIGQGGGNFKGIAGKTTIMYRHLKIFVWSTFNAPCFLIENPDRFLLGNMSKFFVGSQGKVA